MKVTYPKNIQKWMLAGLSFQIGPISLTLVQLFLVAIWAASALAIFNSFSKSWGKMLGIIMAVIVLILFLFVAFFKVSELWLIAFIAKLIRNNFFDVTRKFQINYEKANPTDILIKEWKSGEAKSVIEQKDKEYDQENLENIKDSQLI